MIAVVKTLKTRAFKVRVTGKVAGEIERRAAEEDVDFSDIIRRALNHYIYHETRRGDQDPTVVRAQG